MSLFVDLTGILPTLQAEAEALMVDSCRVERQGEVVTDPETGAVTRPGALVYEGRCKVQQTISQSVSPEAGEHQFTVQDSSLHIPVGAGPVAVGDTVTLTEAALNPALVGNVYRVTETFEKSFATAQRVRVEEVQ